MDANELPQLIAQRVAARRNALGLSLDDLATTTGVSRAMISRIERGEVHASAVVLDRLCGGIGLTLSALFSRADDVSPVLRFDEQRVWRDPVSGYRRREVAPAGARSRLIEVEFPAGAEVSFAATRRTFEQLVWVLEGAIEISFSQSTFRLERGDCLHMKDYQDVVFRNDATTPARYTIVLTEFTA